MSGVACTSTGTLSRASRSVSAIARSSPKLGKRDDYAVNASTVFLEQRSATLGFLVSFYGTMLALLRRQCYIIHASLA